MAGVTGGAGGGGGGTITGARMGAGAGVRMVGRFFFLRLQVTFFFLGRRAL